MIRPIVCTVILIINCIFYVVYVPPRIKAFPEKLKKNDGLQGQNSRFAIKEYEKYYWPSLVSMLVALAAFVFNGLDKPGTAIALSVIALLGVVLDLVLLRYYKNIIDEYKLTVYNSYANRWRFRGDEGIHFAIVAGLTVYQIVLLFL